MRAGTSSDAAKVTATSPREPTTVLRSATTRPRCASTTRPAPTKCQSWTPSIACSTSNDTLQSDGMSAFAVAEQLSRNVMSALGGVLGGGGGGGERRTVHFPDESSRVQRAIGNHR